MSAETVLEAKDGKIHLRQKGLRWDDTAAALRELLAFADYLGNPATETPLKELPPEYFPLVAKLVVESDKTVNLLSRQIKKAVLTKCGVQEDKSIQEDPRLPYTALTAAIHAVADRVNYGVQASPATLTAWRWEIKDPSRMLPDASTDTICNAQVALDRRKAREEAQAAFKSTWATLDDEQKKTLLEKQKKTAGPKEPSTTTSATTDNASGSTAVTRKEKDVKVSPAKEPKKAVKTAEKPSKQSMMMNSFFKKAPVGKPKADNPTTPGTSQNDFERVFKPFLPRKGIVVAPVNFFHVGTSQSSSSKGKQKAEVIVLDDDGDVEMSVAPEPRNGERSLSVPVDVKGMNADGILRSILSHVPSSRLPRQRGRLRASPSKRSPTSDKTNGALSVRQIVTKLNEAEVTGNEKAVRHYERLLKNRNAMPLKYLQFADNLRPGYYGTWTKSSSFVGPRTPFAKDSVTFDYSYDSGEEWEEEPEDAEEVASSVGDDEEEEESPEADEFDDWLVGDEDVELEEGAQPQEPPRSTSPPTTAKRKHDAEKEKEKETKKRKVKVLIPYTSGPHWENNIGAAVDHLQGFRIQLLNDTPFPIDPFTFISEDVPTTQPESTSEPHKSTIPVTGKASGQVSADGFAIPALPAHLRPSSQANLPTAPTVKKMGPKKAIADKYVYQLLKSIDGSEGTQAGIVERLGAEFASVRKEVPKTALAPFLKEVAVKEKNGVWKVKSEAWARVDIQQPPSLI